MSPELSAAFSAGHLWRGTGRASHVHPPLATGHRALDQALGGGWPWGCLVEILVPQPGQGEFKLFLPALAALTAADRPAFLIRPPHVPYGPGLVQQGMELSRVIVVTPVANPSFRDVFWAMEEILAGATGGAVLAWTGMGGGNSLRRLQLAAGRSEGLAVLIRSRRCQAERSPAALRLGLQRQADGGLRLEFLKNPFGRTAILSLEPPGPG